MQLFKDKGVKMVDTTCPWVAKVWNSVDQHSRKSYTSVIHGKYSHEETIATASFADTYVIVRDLAEAQMVVDYILNGGDREAFLKHFEKAVSKGFDPDRDLVCVGLANQVSYCWLLCVNIRLAGCRFEMGCGWVRVVVWARWGCCGCSLPHSRARRWFHAMRLCCAQLWGCVLLLLHSTTRACAMLALLSVAAIQVENTCILETP
jgi:hypothetical protein